MSEEKVPGGGAGPTAGAATAALDAYQTTFRDQHPEWLAVLTRNAERHADIIRRFGRFPHRNHVLRRQTTPEEQAFLDAGGFSG